MSDTKRAPRQLTIADLCEAIADGEIAYTLNHGDYQIKGAEVHRLGREHDMPLLDPSIPLDAPSIEMDCPA